MSSGNTKTVLRFDNKRLKWRLVEPNTKKWLHTCIYCGSAFLGGHERTDCYTCTYSSRQKVAHAEVSRAVTLGQLPSLSTETIACVDCGSRARCYDHRDYSKPLQVDPVCAGCNRRRGSAIDFCN